MKTLLATLTIGLSVLVQSPLRAEVSEPSPTVTTIPAPVSGAPTAFKGPSYNDPLYTHGPDELTALGNATVQIETEFGFGSGTVFRFQVNSTKFVGVLTNAHVVAKSVMTCMKKEDECKVNPPRVLVKSWLHRDGKIYPLFYYGKVVLPSFNPALDIAVVKLDEDWVGDYATFAPADLSLSASEEVFVVGSPLAEKTQVSSGLINLLDSRGKIGVSAPIYPGNSGGGAYVFRGKYYFIGIPSEIRVVHTTDAFTHGYVIPSWTINRYLSGLGVSVLS